jgi:hypothetical protein
MQQAIIEDADKSDGRDLEHGEGGTLGLRASPATSAGTIDPRFMSAVAIEDLLIDGG